MPGPIDELKSSPWPIVAWDPSDKPILVADGESHPVATLRHRVEASSAYVVGISDKRLAHLCSMLRADSLHFYEMRARDLSPLRELGATRHLAIRWNTKLADLSPLSGLSSLRTLVLEDTPKVSDLSPLSALQSLHALEFSGGIWSKNRVETLFPLTHLPLLEEVRLFHLAVAEGGLRPLAGCRALRTLRLSNQFPTEDYAFLAARLPDVECELFAPFVRLGTAVGGKDVMVVGKGKPFLRFAEDADKLARYERKFRELRERFALGQG